MTRVVRFSLVGLIVKGELESGLSMVDLELKAPSNRPRSRGELKYSKIVRRFKLAEAKKKKRSKVE